MPGRTVWEMIECLDRSTARKGGLSCLACFGVLWPLRPRVLYHWGESAGSR